MITNNATPLSAEEIEREQEKFEKWHLVITHDAYRPLPNHGCSHYDWEQVAWLAAKSESASEIAALKAKLAAVEKDAERGRFLITHLGWLRPAARRGFVCAPFFTSYEYDVFKTAEEAVDDAIASAKEQKP